MAAMTIPGTETFEAPEEHRRYRLPPMLIAIVEDIAHGIEAGESGLKSCALGGLSAAAAGASAAEVNASHHRELAVIEDEDECFNRIGDLLAAGYTHAEVAKMVTLGGGATHLLALERWCDKVRIECNADVEPPSWAGSSLHERRRRGQRAMTRLRQTVDGVTHAAVLHVVYGHPDPMLLSARRFMRDCETAIAGEAPKLDPADRDVFNLAKVLLEMGDELAPLARYTPAVEARRQEMIHMEAARRLRRVDGAIPLADHRARVAAADRILSSTDALRDGIAAPAPKREDETRLEHEERVERTKRERVQFLSAVKVDANVMLTAASAAFHGAWLRV